LGEGSKKVLWGGGKKKRWKKGVDGKKPLRGDAELENKKINVAGEETHGCAAT